MDAIAISDSSANRLYWLGRYAERTYLTLHFLRRAYDLLLDGDRQEFSALARLLGAASPDTMTLEQFAAFYIFEEGNPGSLYSALKCANDNAILLREIIKSESLSYIQMAVCHLERLKSSKDELTVTSLQKITDCMLAFFGSMEERLLYRKVVAFVRYGRFVESLDMHLRFEYPYQAVRGVTDCLKRWTVIDDSVIDKYALERFDALLNDTAYRIGDPAYKSQMIATVNRIVAM